MVFQGNCARGRTGHMIKGHITIQVQGLSIDGLNNNNDTTIQ